MLRSVGLEGTWPQTRQRRAARFWRIPDPTPPAPGISDGPSRSSSTRAGAPSGSRRSTRPS